MTFTTGKKPEILNARLVDPDKEPLDLRTYWVHAEFRAAWDPLLFVPGVAESRLAKAVNAFFTVLQNLMQITIEGDLVFAYVSYSQLSREGMAGFVARVNRVAYQGNENVAIPINVLIDTAKWVIKEFIPYDEGSERIYIYDVEIKTASRAPIYATGEPTPLESHSSVSAFATVIGGAVVCVLLWKLARR